MSDDAETPVVLHAPDGARLTVSAHGGQVLGWAPSEGIDRFYLSPTATFGDGAAIRGGVPVIFPQFSVRGSLPKHGIVRDRPWSAHALPDAHYAVWQTWINDDDATRAIWPHRFGLELTVRANAAELDIAVRVTNCGDEPWSFALALHDYLAVGSPATTLIGLSSHPVEQNATPGTVDPDGLGPEAWTATGTRDVRVLDVKGAVEVSDPVLGPLFVAAEGFPDRVVWNPGPGHGIGDVPEGDEQRFFCIEPAVVDPVRLGPGEVWTATHRLNV